MPAPIGTDLHVVAEWSVGPKTDRPGIILILQHLSLADLSPGAALTQTAVILTPQQASLLAADLVRNAALFPSSPSSATN
jgi:hypothetical protein